MTTIPQAPTGQGTHAAAFATTTDTAPPAEVRFRDAREADLPALAAIEAGFPSDRTSPALFRRLMGSGRASVRVAELDGRVIGYHVVRRRWFDRAGWLFSLAVAPEFRRQGIGRRLLADAERVARRAGRTGLTLEVRQDNAAALALYVRAGYRRVKSLVRYYADGTDGWRYRREWK